MSLDTAEVALPACLMATMVFVATNFVAFDTDVILDGDEPCSAGICFADPIAAIILKLLTSTLI